jgi:coenzyme F420-reducing hydrogenase beta subunit
MKAKWNIDRYKIIVECECGTSHEFDKQDLDDYINLTCHNCGRMISAGIDISISPEESNPVMRYRMIGGEYHNQGGTIPGVESEE